ncbi:flagellar basal body-associated protein FliL [Halalkalibacter sp. APA_J-10(15)]|uniref:flagellar basal body-associated protein FliL n=1 Tax=unclassified Halalkalibacter TaxID=2893063 RepID=UPI001FF4077D|nr:flagellar basal body-associated protein FliL [Halalkalibacter sp. APA_J-10(15)]MCK0470761.1 flagellar basal body-associated protein FliL [Halalkalibacter sp. APA_J-10(15)]
MFKNKLVNIMLIILAALTLLGVIVFVLFNQFLDSPEEGQEPTIDQIINLSFDTDEITTNLQSNDFIRATFRIQVDSRSALSEIQKRDFQINNILLRSLSNKRSSELAGNEGIVDFENSIRDEINALMQEGEVVQVYTTSWVIQ